MKKSLMFVVMSCDKLFSLSDKYEFMYINNYCFSLSYFNEAFSSKGFIQIFNFFHSPLDKYY